MRTDKAGRLPHLTATRRSAILGLGAAAALPFLTRQVYAQSTGAGLPPGSMSGKRIIIVGAGLAGLAAANALAAAGAEIALIEARDRIGGRLWTSRVWEDLPVDLGASWIHGTTGNPLTALADKAQAKRVATSYDSAIARGPDEAKLDLDADMERVAALVTAARAEQGQTQGTSLADAITGSPAWQAASADEQRLIRHYVNANIEQEYGGSWAELSARAFDAGTEFPGGDVLFPDGFDQILRPPLQRTRLLKSQAVTAFAPDGGGVAVTLANGTVMTADHAIVTLPLGVLRDGSVTFATALDPARQAAIDTIGMGLLNKCCLRFNRIAWPGDVDWIEWLGPKDGEWAEWLSLGPSARHPVLVAFHAGDQARAKESLTDEAMMAEAHEVLKAMFGTGFPAPLAAQVTRWSQDPFARGSYSFNAAATADGARAALAGADWDGALIFAGEAASADHYGTAHGAHLSGIAAAEAIAAL